MLRVFVVSQLMLVAGAAAALAQDRPQPPPVGLIRELLAREVARAATLPIGVNPQSDDPDWARVRSLRRGKRIVLAASAAVVEDVDFQQADDSSLTISTGRASRTIPKEDVIEIRYPETYYARWGLLAGLAVGATWGIRKCGTHSDLVGLCGILGGGPGLALGAAVGGAANALSHEREVIYHAAAANAAASVAHADDVAWSGVRKLSAGEDVRLVLDDATFLRGAFRSADNLTIALTAGGREQTTARPRVGQVFVNAGTTRARHAGWGIAAGAAVGIAAFGDQSHSSSSPPYFMYAMGTGAIVGALAPAHIVWREVYVKSPPVH